MCTYIVIIFFANKKNFFEKSLSHRVVEAVSRASRGGRILPSVVAPRVAPCRGDPTLEWGREKHCRSTSMGRNTIRTAILCKLCNRLHVMMEKPAVICSMEFGILQPRKIENALNHVSNASR